MHGVTRGMVLGDLHSKLLAILCRNLSPDDVLAGVGAWSSSIACGTVQLSSRRLRPEIEINKCVTYGRLYEGLAGNLSVCVSRFSTADRGIYHTQQLNLGL